jgi:hypothetical protein
MPIQAFATPEFSPTQSGTVSKIILNPEDDLEDSENQESDVSEIVHDTSLPNEVQNDVIHQLRVPIPRNGMFSTMLNPPWSWTSTHMLQ